MTARDRELAIPPDAEVDPQSFELLRVWAALGECETTIRSDLKGGAAAFGVMLCDLARHAALLYSERESIPPLEMAERIKDAFEREWKSVEWPTGGISK